MAKTRPYARFGVSLVLMTSSDQKRLHTVLATRFGMDALHPFQAAIMGHVLAGQSVLAVVATGAGKSLCYQLPSVFWEDQVLVVSPLVALMHHQAARMRALNINSYALTGQLTEREQHTVIAEWAKGTIRLLYVAPERLVDARFRKSMRDKPPRLLVVDEAHCISEWGYDFRPDYRRIRQFREIVGNPPILALTATATDRVKADIRWHLTLDREPFWMIDGSINRPNLFLAVKTVSSTSQQRQHVTRLSRETDGGVIVYTPSRKGAQRWASVLGQSLGEPVYAYHAGLEPSQRRAIEQGFLDRSIRIVVATTAFGMGIDRADIRRVIHVGVPDSLDAYYQEIGRAGRDGKPAVVSMVVQPQDLYRREEWIRDDRPDPEAVRTLVNRVANQPLDRPVIWELDPYQIPVTVMLSFLQDRGTVVTEPVMRGIRVTRLSNDVKSQGEAVLHRMMRLWEERRGLFEHMVGYIEAKDCRRAVLLRYYGQTVRSEKPCCDRCQSPASEPVAKRPNSDLAHRLRLWRMDQAKLEGIPPYMVLSDADLMGLAIKRPSTIQELSQSRGMGPKRLSKYQEQLLSVIGQKDHTDTEGIDPASARDRAVWHFRKGTPWDQVAGEVGRSESTVRAYLTEWIGNAPQEDWQHYVLQLVSEEDYAVMRPIMDRVGTDRLRPLFEALHGTYGFDQWDVARAVYVRRSISTQGRDT